MKEVLVSVVVSTTHEISFGFGCGFDRFAAETETPTLCRNKPKKNLRSDTINSPALINFH